MLNPRELPLTERKGLMGLVYLRAVTAVAGYAFAQTESDFDSIDATITSRDAGKRGIGFQVKCTTVDLGQGSDFAFRLSAKNFNDLLADSLYPRYLLVVVTPKDPCEWLGQNERRLHLRRCGYWASLAGRSKTTRETVTIRVERSKVLTPLALRQLMLKGGPV